MNLQKKLLDLREERELTQQQLADKLQIDIKTYNRYEKGLHEIKLSILIKLAEFYNISIDYLVGLIEEPKPISTKNEIIKPKEKKLLKAYSDNPKLQKAIDIILNIED